MRKRVVRSLFFALLACSGSALADPTPSEIALARQLFTEALRLEGTGNWAGAMLKLRDAIAIKETPGLRYHLAHCEEQSGELVAASLDYERASELIRAGAQAPDVEQLLELANQRLVNRIPRLTLLLPPGVTDATVEIDGQAVSPALVGKAAPIDPGRHRIAARAPGRVPFEKELTIVSGENHNLDLELAPLPSANSNLAPLPAQSKDGASRHVKASPGGFGAREATLIGEAVLVVAGLGVGIGYTLARSSATDRAQRFQEEIDAESAGDPGACQAIEPPLGCAGLDDALEDRQRDGTIATLGFVGAGVSAAALATTWLLWPTSREAVALQLRPRGVGFDLRAGFQF